MYKPYPKMKQSGVPWIGEIPEHWELRRLRFIFNIKKNIAGKLGFDVLSITQRGIVIKDIESNDGQLSMDYSKYQLVEIGDFAMNHMDLLTGYVDISPYKGVTSPDYRVFTLNNKRIAYSRYYVYLLQMCYHLKIFYSYGKGVSLFGRWRLPSDEFNDIEFPVIPLPEQRAIAAFLDRETSRIDALIDKKERLIALLKEKRQALITRAVTKGLDPTAKMKDSGVPWIGEIPAGWEVCQLRRKLSTYNSIKIGPFGSSLRLEMMVSSGYKVYGQENVIADDFTIGERYIDANKYEEMKGYSLYPDDVVITMMGTSGRCKVIPNGIATGIMDSHLLRLRTQNNQLLPQYLSLVFDKSYYVNEQVSFLGKGSIMNGLNSTIVKSILVIVPSIEEQKQIIAFLDRETSRIDAIIDKVTEQITTLRELRQTLISHAVTGKIDVRGEVAVSEIEEAPA